MKRLLLVEDNPDDEALTLRAIRSRNLDLEVFVAHDGQEAVEMLGLEEGLLQPVFPDFVVLDLKLPKLSGHEVLAMMQAHDRTRELPVMILSSSDQQIDVDGAAKMGVKHLRKPNDYHAFLETVGEAIEILCRFQTSS